MCTDATTWWHSSGSNKKQRSISNKCSFGVAMLSLLEQPESPLSQLKLHFCSHQTPPIPVCCLQSNTERPSPLDLSNLRCPPQVWGLPQQQTPNTFYGSKPTQSKCPLPPAGNCWNSSRGGSQESVWHVLMPDVRGTSSRHIWTNQVFLAFPQPSDHIYHMVVIHWQLSPFNFNLSTTQEQHSN